MPGPEIVVIGGGMLGAAVTYRLAERGLRTTLVDAGEPGRGTSASSFAWLNSASKEPRPYHDQAAQPIVAPQPHLGVCIPSAHT